jgi:hypothetical protein
VKIALVQQHATRDPEENRECHARRHFLEDRRPGVYRKLGLMAKRPAD